MTTLVCQQNKPLWILERAKKSTPIPFRDSLVSLEQALVNAGIPYEFAHRPLMEQYTVISDHARSYEGPVIVYGSLHFIRDIKGVAFYPGAFGYMGTDYFNVISHVPREWLVNSDFNITTFGEFKRNFEYWFRILGTEELFVRPVSDKKIFSGDTIDLDSVRNNESLFHYNEVAPETPIIVARYQMIENEYRYVICDRKVVARSNSIYLFKLNENEIEECDAFAEKVAALDWQPDTCYVVDIGYTLNGAAIVEYNSFCSAGLYGANAEKIVEALSNKAIQLYYEV